MKLKQNDAGAMRYNLKVVQWGSGGGGIYFWWGEKIISRWGGMNKISAAKRESPPVGNTLCTPSCWGRSEPSINFSKMKGGLTGT